ncbi:MAG: DUF4245 domain-containing protein [Streptomyces sp.]
MAAEAGKQRGGRQTVRGMVPSLAVVLLAAGVIYLFVPHDADQDPVKPVSYQVELASARRAAPYPVLAPEGLAKTWRATSVTYEGAGPDGAAWHLGFMTPDNQYAAVEQSDAARPVKFTEDATQRARKTARTERIDGREWRRYEGAKYDALVRQDTGKRGRHTTVVTGTASFAQLRELAAALRPGDGDGSDGGNDGGARQG